MDRNPSPIIGLFLLLTIPLVACRLSPLGGGNQETPKPDPIATTAKLPVDEATILYQPDATGSNTTGPAYLISAQDGAVSRWQPEDREDFLVWELPPDAYRFVRLAGSEANRLLFLGQDGRYASYDIDSKFMPNMLSPDGRYVYDSWDKTIKRIDQASQEATGGNMNSFGRWSADSGQYLYRVKVGESWQLVLHSVQTNQQTVVMEASADIWTTAWSADGSRIAVALFTSGAGTTLYQYTDQDTTLLRTDPLPFLSIDQLVYLPDNRSLLLVGTEDKGTAIYRFGPDDPVPNRIFQTDTGIKSLKISPDGRWLLFFDNSPSLSQTVTRLSVDGGTPYVSSMDPRFGHAAEIQFSPDASKVAILFGLTKNPRGFVNTLWVLDAPGTANEPTRVAPPGDLPDELWGGEDDKEYLAYAGVTDFVWSPDSQRLYVIAALEGSCKNATPLSRIMPSESLSVSCSAHLYQVDAVGTGFKQISTVPIPVGQIEPSAMFWLP